MNEDKLKELQDAFQKGTFNADMFKEYWPEIQGLLKSISGKGDTSLAASELIPVLQGFSNWAQNTPEGQAALKQTMRDNASQRFIKQFKPFFNTLLSGVDLATSLNQIKTSNNTIKSIIQPAIATSPGQPTELNAQLQQAQNQGGVEAQRAVAPAQAELAQQYANDVNTAKQVSGGQGSSYQANVQNASLRRQRAALGLAPIVDSVKARYQNMANQLATSKAQLGQQDFGNRLYGSQLALDQYNRQMAAAGALGQAGRLNLRNTLQGLSNNLPSLFGQILPKQQPQIYMQSPIQGAPLNLNTNMIAPKGSTPITIDSSVNNDYGDWSNYAKQVKSGLLNTINLSNPSYLPY